MKRRHFLQGSGAFVSLLCAPPVFAGGENYNHYVVRMADEGHKVTRAKAGDTWQSVFGKKHAELARSINRQNLQLEVGQWYLGRMKFPSLEKTTLFDHSPLGKLIKSRDSLVVVSPGKFAWGYYQGGRLVRWGPAVAGNDWCADVGRSCTTPSGTFFITEFAGPNRRSSSYPRELAQEGKGALMPYFMRLTEGGVGMHARYIRGRHETHGCIGMFYADARWLNATLKKSQTKGSVAVVVEHYTP